MVSPLAWRPKSRLSTPRKRAEGARSTLSVRSARQASNRIVSCGSHSRVAPAAAVRRVRMVAGGEAGVAR
jgi:hypothetical protein